jgi:hypothetical protein
MKTTIDMAREAGWTSYDSQDERFKAFESLVRADEREQGQKWFDAVTAQHKQEILAEREACAKLCETLVMGKHCAAAIRSRGENT